MFTKKSGLFLISLLLMMGCASPKPLFPVPTEVSTPLPLEMTTVPTLEQIQTVPAMPPTLTFGQPANNASTQIQPTPEVTWNSYHSDTYGFSFAYPSAYDEPQYQTCSLKIVEQPDGAEFSIGHQSNLNVQQKGSLDLRDYVDNLVTQKQTEAAWTVESHNIRMVGGLEAVEVNYRFGGTNRFGTATFLIHQGLLLTFNFYAGAFCDVPEIDLTERQAYAQWIDSLKFDE